MLSLSIQEVEPGMMLAAPVYNPQQPDQIILNTGVPMETKVIQRMQSRGILTVYVAYPGLEYLDTHLAPHLSPARQECLSHIKNAINNVQSRARPGVPFNDYKDNTRQLIETILAQGEHPVFLEQMATTGQNHVFHAASVAHLSLMLGLKLESYLVSQRSRLSEDRARDIVSLGVAGMLHDIGLLKLPPTLQGFSDVDRPETETSQRLWESHVEAGFESLRGEIDPTSAAAIFQHHQHFDGSGFPLRNNQGMSGQRIHVFARILLAANLYERLVNPPRGTKRSNHEALRLLNRDYAAWIDPVILKALNQIVPPYPPGSRVDLTDGTKAVVVDLEPGNPTKPLVRRLEPDGKTLTSEQLDLRLEGSPQIVVADAERDAAPTAPDKPCKRQGSRVMISYSSKDAPVAFAACKALETAGLRCWIAPRDITPGVNWGEAIVDAIENAALLVMVVSTHASASPQVVREVERAVNLEVPIIPFRIDTAPLSKALQYFLSSSHWLNATTAPLAPHLEHLVAASRRILAEKAGKGAAETWRISA